MDRERCQTHEFASTRPVGASRLAASFVARLERAASSDWRVCFGWRYGMLWTPDTKASQHPLAWWGPYGAQQGIPSGLHTPGDWINTTGAHSSSSSAPGSRS